MLSQDEAARFLSARYGTRADGLAQLGAGAWSRAYAMVLDGRDVVVRFGAHREDYEKDRIMGAAGSARLPIPRVLEVDEAPGGFFAVSERVRGAPLDDLDAAGMRAALPSLFAALDALRAVDVSGRRGYGGWGADGTGGCGSWREAVLAFAGDRLVGWRAALEGSPTGTGPLETCFSKLQEMAADLPDIRQVIHGDLLARNVLVEGPEISGVLDWGCSMYGDALYDSAWLLFWWSWEPRWADIDIRAELDRHWAAMGGAPADLDDRLRCYQVRIGLDHMAWYAYTRDWDALARVARQTLALAAG